MQHESYGMTNLYFSEKPELIFESDHHGNTVMVSFYNLWLG